MFTVDLVSAKFKPAKYLNGSFGTNRDDTVNGLKD